MSRRPLSERLCESVTLLFAAWTVCCHVVVFVGGSMTSLLRFSALAATALLGLAWWRRRASPPASPSQGVETAPPDEAPRPALIEPAYGALAIGGLCMFGAIQFGHPVVLWATMVALLSIGCWTVLRSPAPRPRAAMQSRFAERSLWLVGLACLIATLIAHRYDPDDTLYVGLAVAAVDTPEMPLMRFDVLHGIEGLELHMPAYRLHSFELAAAAFAYITGIPAFEVFHWYVAGLFALLVPLALAALFRQLVPDSWLLTTICAVGVLLAVGGTHRWHGNFGFVRMWQGKSVYLSFFLPLIYAYGVRFALRPSWRTWSFLAAAQIAALGATSSAVWSGPVAGTLAVICAVRPNLRAARLAVVGMLSSVYVLAVGLYLKATVTTAIGFQPSREPMARGENFAQALVETSGEGRLYVFGLLTLALAWALQPNALARGFTCIVPLVVWSLFLNPYLDDLIIKNVVGQAFWRTLWAIPIPILMALLLTALMTRAGRGRGAILRILSNTAIFALFAIFIPLTHSLSQDNRVYIRWPDLKVPHLTYDWAVKLVERVPPRASVIVPDEIGQWIPTFHEHPYQLEIGNFLYVNRRNLQEGDYERRNTMRTYVGGGLRDDPEAGKTFAEGLRHYDVQAVILNRENTDLVPAQRILRLANFGLADRGRKREMWLRGDIFEVDTFFDDDFEGSDLRAWSETAVVTELDEAATDQLSDE